jgi:hypothetical protein
MNYMWELLARFGLALVPPLDADPKHVYGWRVRVAVIACMAFAIASGQLAWGQGWIPGLDGFAKVSEVQNIVKEIRTNRVEILESHLLDLRDKHCKAGSEEAKRLYWARISELLVKYQELTNRVFQLPACTDL